MQKTLRSVYRLLCVIVMVCMAAMTVMVFVNVVLRYVANSGIILSEELSRYCFVWMTFCGAVVAAVDNIHIRVDVLYKKFPRAVRRIVAAMTGLLIVGCCVILAYGSAIQTWLNRDNAAPASGLPIAFVYFPMVLSGVCMAGIYLFRVWQAVSGTENEVKK